MDSSGFPSVDAGAFPGVLLEVCAMWNVLPERLLGWSVRRDGVTLILPSGQKVGVSVKGEWGLTTDFENGLHGLKTEGAAAAPAGVTKEW